MKKVYRVVAIREQRTPTGTWLIIGLQDEQPVTEKSDALAVQLNALQVPEVAKQQVGALLGILSSLSPGVISDLALTSEEYKRLGSPPIASVLNVDMELFKE